MERRQQCREQMEQGRAGRVPGPEGEWDLAERGSDKGLPQAQDKAPGGEPDADWGAAWAADRVEDKAAAQAWVAGRVEADSIKKGEWIMPGGDRTGPMGMGPMSGRAAGFCAGYGAPSYVNAGWGRGFGMGFGRGGGGRGRRNRFFATGMTGWMRAGAPYAQSAYTPEQELDALKQQAEYFGNALEEIRKQIQELEAKPTEK